MSYREMAIDSGARGEDEIRQLAAEAERCHRAAIEREEQERQEEERRRQWCPECGQDGLRFDRYGVCTGCVLCEWEPEGEGADS